MEFVEVILKNGTSWGSFGSVVFVLGLVIRHLKNENKSIREEARKEREQCIKEQRESNEKSDEIIEKVRELLTIILTKLS